MKTLLRRLLCGTAGGLMVVALLLPWTAIEDADRVGWGLWKLTFPLCLALAGCALTTAITGGRIGLNRPDVSIIGATDGLGVITTIILAWLFYVLPADASVQPALILALACAAVAALAAADYRPLRGAPLFPRLVDERASGQRAGRSWTSGGS